MNKPPPDKTSQSERFIETARALGCDEDEAAFRDKLRVVARQKPEGKTKPPKAKPQNLGQAQVTSAALAARNDGGQCAIHCLGGSPAS